MARTATASIDRHARAAAGGGSGLTLWWCGLERSDEDSEDTAAPLSPAESARAERFGTDALRMRWIAGRAALRSVLGRTLGVDPAAVAIRSGVRAVPSSSTPAPASTSMSRTRGALR